MAEILMGWAGISALFLLAVALFLLTCGAIGGFRRGRPGEGLLFSAGVISGLSLTIGLIVWVSA